MNRDELERAYAITATLRDRKKNDPMRLWQPHAKQKPFIEDLTQGKIPEAWMLAANRTGKSEAGAYVGSHFARFGPATSHFSGSGKDFIEVRDRATSGWVVAMDYRQLQETIQPKYFDNGVVAPGATRPFIPDREIADFRRVDQLLKLKNGSIISFKSADSDITKFYGAGKDWIHFDEEPPKNVYDECVIRVEAGRTLTVFGTCTILPPEGVQGGVSWLFSHVVKPWQNKTLKNINVYTASIYDNPHISRDEITRLESKYPEGSPIRRIRLNGELIPGIGGSRAFGAFDANIHINNDEDEDYNFRRPLCWMWDFNVEPFITHVGQRNGDIFQVYKQLYLESGSIADMVQLYYSQFNWWRGPVYIYGDATGQNRGSQTAMTDYTVMFNEFRNYSIQGVKKVPTQNPPVTDRINAMNVALKGPYGTSSVKINPSCTELIDDLEQVLLDPKGGIKKSHNPRDEYYKRTHAVDGVSYWVCYEAPIQMIHEPRETKIKRASYG